MTSGPGGRKRLEEEEFARGHIGPGEEPVEPRPAATMVLAREAQEGFRILLLRRPDEARFAAGAHVFPGGAVDPEDAIPDADERLGEDATRAEPAALAAALREGLEETGLLPADRLPDAEELEGAREALLRGETDLPELVRHWDLTFHGLRTAYFARWITPARLSRRYDARFFLTEHRGGEPRLLHVEHTGAAWIRPGEALRRFEAGDLPMLFPTRKTVEALAGFGSLPDAMEAFRRRRVTPVRPRLHVEGRTVVPVLPDDPRYVEAALDRT